MLEAVIIMDFDLNLKIHAFHNKSMEHCVPPTLSVDQLMFVISASVNDGYLYLLGCFKIF